MRGVVALLYGQHGLRLDDLIGDDPRILPTALELQRHEADEIARATRRR